MSNFVTQGKQSKMEFLIPIYTSTVKYTLAIAGASQIQREILVQSLLLRSAITIRIKEHSAKEHSVALLHNQKQSGKLTGAKLALY